MDSLKPEELSQLSEKVEKGEALTDEELARVTQNLPNLKKTVDGLYSRAKSAEDDFKDYKSKNPPASPTPAEPPKKPEPVVPELSIKEVLKLRKEGFSDEEILDLTERAQSLGTPVEKVLSDPIFKAGMEARREKARAEGAVPPSGSPSLTAGGKSWDDIALKGTPEEQSQAFAEIMRAKAAGGNRSAM